MEEIKNKIKAVVIGHAIGDALGVPVEFCERAELADKPITDMVGYGTYSVPAGAWSDDTSMSLAALDSLASGELDYIDIMENFAKWLEAGKYTPTGESFDVGQTCLRSILNFVSICYSQEHGFLLPPGMDITEFGQNGEYSNGNGALMRIHPFALMTWYDRNLRPNFEEIIERASALTHAHERSKLACKIYTLILYNLLGLPRKDVIMFALDMAKCRYFESPEYHHYDRLFDDNFDKLTIDEIKSSGYVVDTLEAAVWCVLTTDNYRDCVLKAVNLGEDTDTVAAIAGGLAGALYGYDGIPEEWKNTLIKREYIEEMCDRAAAAWYTPEPPPEKCEYPIVDLHMHVVPDLDDGSRSGNESLKMLTLAAQQGVTDVFCTTHNGCSPEDGEQYEEAFADLRDAVIDAGIDIKLHKGCEVLCAEEYMDDIIYGLDEGIFSTLGDTKYVLTELYSDTKPSEALKIIKALQEHGYHPIIAHMERNFNITGPMVGTLIQCGAFIQVNAYSFADETDEGIRQNACELLRNKYVHFIGSDGHRIDYRAPKVDAGVKYILENTDKDYALEILHGNAKHLLGVSCGQNEE